VIDPIALPLEAFDSGAGVEDHRHAATLARQVPTQSDRRAARYITAARYRLQQHPTRCPAEKPDPCRRVHPTDSQSIRGT
jgi:hypothetical protein